MFCDLFGLPLARDAPVDGSSDEQPLRLEGIKENDFRQLLRVMYPRLAETVFCHLFSRLTLWWHRHAGQRDAMSFAEWTSVLKLSTMWNFEGLRSLAIQSMSGLPDNDAVEKAALAGEYQIDEWLLPALNELAQREEPISIEEARRLGWEVALQLSAVRESFIAWNEKMAFGARGARPHIDFTGRIRTVMGI